MLDNQRIKPFVYNEDKQVALLELDELTYKQSHFKQLNWQGCGYDWEEVIIFFIAKTMPHLLNEVYFCSKNNKFMVSCANKRELCNLAFHFSQCCANDLRFKLILIECKLFIA